MNKPGFKTTEFWVTVVVQLSSILALAGVFTDEQASTWARIAEQAGGLVAMILSQVAYSGSRSRVKTAEIIKQAECK